MATEGAITVDQMYLTFSDAEGNPHVVAACETDASLNITADTIEQDCKDTAGAASYKKGKVRWSASGAADFAFDSAFGYKQFYDKIVDGDAKMQLRMTTGSTEAGDFYIEGSALATTLNLASPGGSNALVTWSFEMLGIGKPAMTVLT